MKIVRSIKNSLLTRAKRAVNLLHDFFQEEAPPERMTVKKVLREVAMEISHWDNRDDTMEWFVTQLCGICAVTQAPIHSVVVGFHKYGERSMIDFSDCDEPAGSHGEPIVSRVKEGETALSFFVMFYDGTVVHTDQLTPGPVYEA